MEGEEYIVFDNPFWGVSGGIILLLQIALVVHVIRTGRPYWWIWIILFFPAVGMLVYGVVEILPELQRGRSFSLGSLFKTRKRRIRELKTLLTETDTVETRMELAAELSALKRFEEAYTVLVECLTGVFRDDPHVLLEVARVQLEMGIGPQALKTLNSVQVDRDKWMEKKRDLLKGWAFYLQGQLPEAEAILQSLSVSYPGEEARYRLGLVLLAGGKKAEAKVLFQDIVTKFRKAGATWRRAERPWYKLAKGKLQEQPSA